MMMNDNLADALVLAEKMPDKAQDILATRISADTHLLRTIAQQDHDLAELRVLYEGTCDRIAAYKGTIHNLENTLGVTLRENAALKQRLGNILGELRSFEDAASARSRGIGEILSRHGSAPVAGRDDDPPLLSR